MKRLVMSGLLLCIPVMLSSQTPAPAGRIAGVLTDPSGAVVHGGRIEIRSADTGLVRSTLSGLQGRYAVDALPAGRYEVTATVPGFEMAIRRDVLVSENRETIVDMSLSILRHATAVEVTASAITLGAEVVPERLGIRDMSSLLGNLPGLSLHGGGGASSVPVIHGLADDRVKVLVNGMAIESACSNHMNPPLSYVALSSVGFVTVMAGITPVSRGGDSLGGTISVEPVPPQFAQPGAGVETHGSIAGHRRSNGAVGSGNASLSVGTENLALAYAGSYVKADNYESGLGVAVKSTFYESTNHALQLSARRGSNVVALGLGLQHVPQQGFVNARMDMTHNNAKFANLRYGGTLGSGTLEARAYYHHARQGMNILRDKIPGMYMPMASRGTNLGYSVQAQIPLSPRDTLLVGNEFRSFLLDEWWPPVTQTIGSMGPDTFWNVRDGRRDRFGSYLEWEARRGTAWTTVLGVRSDVVRMNAGNVAGYNMSTTATGSAAYYADATEFNSRDRRRLDYNFDVTALARYAPGPNHTVEFGYARKTRSPNLHERYLWAKRSAMSAQMSGWFGDANGYTGNLELRPEVANTLSATASWRSAADTGWELKVTPYHTRVSDYIDVDRCPVIADGSNGCTAARFAATTGFVTLQFANHAARLYGVDAEARMPLGSNAQVGDFALSGVLGYVRGSNLDTGDNLYQIMPANAAITLEHRRGDWSTAIDFRAVAAKRDVQAVRNELRAPSYALVNVNTGYEWHPTDGTTVRLDVGIDNLANRNYVLPLGGRYWVGDATGMSAVPGMGRSVHGGLSLNF
jgi:iron complex outermembrane recepter protein